jgi:ABC-type enterobactin transport system permease subunit
MRQIIIPAVLTLVAAAPCGAVEFLGVELCKGSVDTSVVLPVGSPLSLESAEIGRHGGLLML